MSGSNINPLTNPAVPNNNEVDTLLIEKFNGTVHKQYLQGENLLSGFTMQEVKGTNIVSNKYIGDTTLQTLTPGQEPEATETEFNKNALVVDTIVLGRNTVHDLHDIQNDFSVMEKLAENQMGKLKTMEDQMIVQQLLLGGLTGGAYDPYANTITGGTSRVSGQGVAINVDLNDDGTQAADPYQLVSAIEICIMGLVIQRVPMQSMKVIVPISEFGLLVDFGFVAQSAGGTNETTGYAFPGMSGILKGYGIPVMGSAEFTQMKLNPHDGATHHLLSNSNNSNRYDVTAAMQNANAIVYRPDGLLTGRTINLQTDIFYDKKTKGYFIDSWFAEGAIPDRYDNIAIVNSNVDGSNNAAVLAKAKGKATATKTYS
jgi:hypothetical protein